MPDAEKRSGGQESDRRETDKARFFLAAIVDSSQDSIVTIDFDGIITTWNKAAEQLYGYSAAEAIGQSLLELTFPDNIKEVLANIEGVKHSRRVEVFDSIRLNKSGQEIHLEVVMSPVKDDKDEIVGVSTIARDITARKLLEQGLEKQVQARTQALEKRIAEKRRLQEQRTQLIQRIVKAQEEERRRVSRELHDNLGQHLTAILLHIRNLQIESRDTRGGVHFGEERRSSMKGLSKLVEMINELTGAAHRLAWELRPAALDNFGLKVALVTCTPENIPFSCRILRLK